MAKKNSTYDLDNALFVLAQLNDALQKGGLTTFLNNINELKVKLTKLEGEIKRVKDDLQKVLDSRKDRSLKIWGVILVPIVIIGSALVTHWYTVESQIHKLDSRIEVLKSIMDERDKKYEIRFLDRGEYLRDLKRGRNHENDSTSRRRRDYQNYRR